MTKSKTDPSLTEEADRCQRDDRLSAALGRLPQDERPAWVAEAERLARLVECYAILRPKRTRHPVTGRYEFVPEACALCRQAGPARTA